MFQQRQENKLLKSSSLKEKAIRKKTRSTVKGSSMISLNSFFGNFTALPIDETFRELRHVANKPLQWSVD